MGSPDRRRVAVTGLGVVSAAGVGADAYFEGLCSPAPVGDRRVTGFDPNAHFESPKEARRADPYTQFLVAAADQALEQAGDIEADPTRCGTMIGTGVGGITTLERQISVLKEKGARRVSPFLVPMMMANAGGATLSMRYGWMGPSENVVTACAASTHAVGNAARLIADGRCDVVLAGGSEAVAVTARARPSCVPRSAITSASRRSMPTTVCPAVSRRRRVALPMPDADPLIA